MTLLWKCVSGCWHGCLDWCEKHRRVLRLVGGVGLVLLGVAFVYLAAIVKANQDETARTARASCQRTLLFAPYVAVDYAKRGVMPPDVLERFRETIPSSCS